jgi:hypothetical protein
MVGSFVFLFPFLVGNVVPIKLNIASFSKKDREKLVVDMCPISPKNLDHP